MHTEVIEVIKTGRGHNDTLVVSNVDERVFGTGVQIEPSSFPFMAARARPPGHVSFASSTLTQDILNRFTGLRVKGGR
jgi:hypothetical protein